MPNIKEVRKKGTQMNLDIDKLKLKFTKYLKKNTDVYDENKDKINSSEVSIFMHADEFKDFLSANGYKASKSGTSLESLMKLEIKDGKIVDPEAEKKAEENKEKGENEDKIKMNDEGFVVEFMNELLNDETFVEAFDEDGSGEINAAEFGAFLQTICGNDGNMENITLEDIIGALSQMSEGKFEISEEAKEKFIAPEEIKSETEQNTPETSSSSYSGGVSGGYSGGSYGSGFSGAMNLPKVETLEELESQKSTKETELQSAQDELNKVLSGEDDAVKKAQDDADKAKEAYDKAVEQDDKINSDLKQKRDENLNAIQTKESEISQTKTEIAAKDAEINSQKSTVTSIESNISALENSKSSLESQQSQGVDDAEKSAKIEQNLSEIEQKLEEARKELESAKEKLASLENEKTALEETLSTKESELTELQTQKANIEQEILANCSEETKSKMEEYNSAKENVDSVKQSRESEAKAKVDQIQGEIVELETKINEKKAQETKSEYSVGNGAEFLAELQTLGGDAPQRFGELCSVLGMSENEAADYLANLCDAPEWGNGCISPSLLLAQICQESGFNPTVVGDSGKALGLGQFHTEAVAEVNNQYGTSYTNEDRANPTKALEMMVLLLKYDYSKTGDEYAMLAMYNQGHAGGINSAGGQKYVRDVLSRIGM